MVPWRYAVASIAGTAHERLGVPCQDLGRCQLLQTAVGEAVLVAVAADGAGSAVYAEIGAQLAADLCVAEVATLLEQGGTVAGLTTAFWRDWLVRVQQEVAWRAEATGGTARDYACTLLAAIVGADCAAYVQIGDGAIVVAEAGGLGEYHSVFWPQQGEYANLTTFVTDPGAAEQLQTRYVEQAVEEVALFTDGLQRLALHFQTQTAHVPFFRPLFQGLRQTASGYQGAFSTSLATFLAAPAVNARTDDDKTLILASRWQAAPPLAVTEVTDEPASITDAGR